MKGWRVKRNLLAKKIMDADKYILTADAFRKANRLMRQSDAAKTSKHSKLQPNNRKD